MNKYDKWLLVITILLVGFGALMIYSSTSVVTPVLEKRNITEFFYFKKHMFTIIVGFLFLALAYYILKPSLLKKLAVPLLVVSGLLLILVFFSWDWGHRWRCQEMDRAVAFDFSAIGVG